MNIPNSILSKVNSNLYLQPNHPISIIKSKIVNAFNFPLIENLSPYVSVDDNFNSLLIPIDHPSRSKSDTFYQDDQMVLRTHMTAHLNQLVKAGNHKYITCGDVYRKDEIDRNHYPVFHQLDSFKLINNPEQDLRTTLSNVIKNIFGDVNFRFLEQNNGDDVYFPFTINSCEVEVEFYNQITGQSKFIEVLGGGSVHPDIMTNVGLSGQTAWAFGMGLERLAMILFDIPDIRLFWSKDERFLSQFTEGTISKFVPFSKYPLCYKDISFWLHPSFKENEFFSIIQEEGNDLIEEVFLVSSFKHPKSSQISKCYRINYRSNERSLTNAEINKIQDNIRSRATKELKLQLR